MSTDFGTKLRDRLLCGVLDPSIQRRLLAEPDSMTLEEALNITQAMESAEQNTRNIQGPQQQMAAAGPEVHSVAQAQRRRRGGPRLSAGPLCTCCGGRDHLPQDCRCKTIVCHACKK